MTSRRSLAAAAPLALVALAALAGCGPSEPAQAPAAPPPAAVGSAQAPLAPAVASPDTTSSAAAPGAPQTPAPAGGQQGGEGDWRQVATAADASALGRLDQAWRLARAEAEDRGFGDELEALGPLVDPDAGQSGRLQPPPGAYSCRTVKLGTRTEGQGLPYIAYPRFRCTVELTPGGDLILTKSTGSQRSRGLLYPDADDRLVFLGAQAWGDETTWPRYGQTRERDQIGVLERIGPDHWRLVIPWPKQEAKIEILELTR